MWLLTVWYVRDLKKSLWISQKEGDGEKGVDW